jgi:DME family drug/metabolite transporter
LMRNPIDSEMKGSLLVLSGGVLWGVIGPFIQVMAKLGASPILISFLRMAFSFAILFVFIVAKFGIRAFRVDKKQLISAALLGLVCHGIYNVFYSIAVNETGVTVSAVLLNIAPFFTAVTAVLLFHEKMNTTKVGILMINVLGCMLAATGGRLAFHSRSMIGLLCGLGAGFCYSMTAILGKIAGERSNVFVLSTYSYLFATLFLLFYGKPWREPGILNPGILWVGFLYALIPTVIGYLLYYRGVQLIRESSKIPVIASSEMIVAGIIGILILHEHVNAVRLLGIGCVFFSILRMSKRKNEEKATSVSG